MEKNDYGLETRHKSRESLYVAKMVLRQLVAEHV